MEFSLGSRVRSMASMVLGLGLGFGAEGAPGSEATPPTLPGHPLPPGVIATLYPEAQGSVSIERLAGHGHRLYVALRDAAGIERLDVWNTRQAARPVRVDSLNFGSVLTNGVRILPLTLVPFPDGLLLQTSAGLTLYRHDASDRLAWVRDLPNPSTGLGPGLDQIHRAGPYGSLLQQVIPNREIDGSNLQQIHQHVLLDLRHPEDPRLFWTGSEGPRVSLRDPINGIYAGNPASLSINLAANTARLVVLEPRIEAQLHDFWRPKLDRIFRPQALNRSLRELVRECVETLDLPTLQRQVIARHGESVIDLQATLTASIHSRWANDVRLIDVLKSHGLSLDDPLEMVLAALIAREIDAGLETELSRALYSPSMQAWLRTILAAPAAADTVAGLKTFVEAAITADLEAVSVDRYLTRYVVGPLLGNPEFMSLTLGELIDHLSESPVGGVIDVTLQTAGGFGALNSVLSALDDLLGLLDFIPWVDVPSLPSCARFPESTRELIELALFSWNDASRGIVLQRDGLAWFELLKFHRYLNGDTDFAAHLAKVQSELRQLHDELGGNLLRQLSPAFGPTLDVLASVPTLVEEEAGQLQSRLAVARLLARSTLEALNADGTLTATQSTREALKAWRLKVGELGVSESTVADLLVAIESRGAAAVTLAAIHEQAGTLDSRTLQQQVEQVLRGQVQRALGAPTPDAALVEALKPCLFHQIDLDRVIGGHLSTILNEMLYEGPGMGGLLVDFRRAFEHQDCIAQWLVTLEAVSAATAVLDEGLAARALQMALDEAYRAGVNALVNTVFGRLISEVVDGFDGNQSLWIAAMMSPRSYEWELARSDAIARITPLGGWVWQDRVGFILERRLEADWFGPRRIEMHVFHPENPEATRRIYDLGRWGHLNSVLQQEGALFLGGDFFTDPDGSFPSGRAMIVDLDAAEPAAQIFRGSDHLPLSVATGLSSANFGAHLAVATVNQVLLLSNPAGHFREQDTLARTPAILLAPIDRAIVEGERLELIVRAAGTPPLTYQWFHDGIAVEGAVSARLPIDRLTESHAGSYHVTVVNDAGEVSSRAARVTLIADPVPRIVGQPADQVAFLGSRVRFGVELEGNLSVPCQWYRNGRAIPGAQSREWEIASVTAADAGEYQARLGVDSSSLTTRAARLTVLEARGPRWLTPPSELPAVVLGRTAALTVRPGGLAPWSCQWLRDGQPIPGATNPTLDLGLVTANTAGN
ncbi:MAG: immunoglobulin domain-containing protein [Limisphaerales bacterium]